MVKTGIVLFLPFIQKPAIGMRKTLFLFAAILILSACWRNTNQNNDLIDNSDSLTDNFGDSSGYLNDENTPDTSDQDYPTGKLNQNSPSEIARLRQTPEFHYKRAHVLYKIRNWTEGIKEFDTVIQMEPNLADAYKYRANGYMQSGRYDAAISDYERAINIDRSDTGSYSQLALCWYNLGNFDKCLEVNTDLVELNPNRAQSYFSRAVVHGQRKDFENAINDFDKAIQLDRNNAEAYFNRGLAFYKSGSLKNACEDWEKAKKLGHGKAGRVLQEHCK